MVGLSKAVPDYQFYNTNDDEIPGLENLFRWLPGLFYYMVHIFGRMETYAILAAHYKLYVAVLLSVQWVWNFVIERFVCQREVLSGNFATAFQSLVAPFCGLEEDKRYRQYCCWHCISFAFNLALTASLLNLLSYHEVIPIKRLEHSAFSDLRLEPLHPNVMGRGLSVIIMNVIISSLSGIFSFWKCACCHDLQEPFNIKVETSKRLIREKWNKIRHESNGSSDERASKRDIYSIQTASIELSDVPRRLPFMLL